MNSVAPPTLKPNEIAAEVLAVIGRRAQVEPISARPPGLDLESAYEVGDPRS